MVIPWLGGNALFLHVQQVWGDSFWLLFLASGLIYSTLMGGAYLAWRIYRRHRDGRSRDDIDEG